MICSNCSHNNNPRARFCEECGQSLARICPKCSEPAGPQAKFCPNCGARFDLEDKSGALSSQISQGPALDRLKTLHSYVPQALKEKMRQAHAGMEGERKPVTILFTDIVGSTSLAEKLDPEEWREIVSAAHQIVSQCIYRYEGTIAQLLGDGVLAFFGAPITHEDDPLRSVQAAVDIQAAVQAFSDTLPASVPEFKMRIGINTGTVVVGNIGHDLHMEYLAIGDAVNLAARLQSASEPGCILVSQDTARLVEHAAELEDLGSITVKGKVEPVQVFKVTRLHDIRGHGRRSLEGSGRLFVGRQAEMNAISNASAAAQAGLGRVVVLIGEPGLGKSRLIYEWRQQNADSLRWVSGECLSYGQGLPYHLIVSWLRDLLQLSDSATEYRTQQALRQLTAELFGDEGGEIYAFLAHLLSLPLSETAETFVQGLNPQGIQVQYMTTLRRLLLALAAQHPLALTL
jgi:class 3 adenylate cyclase